MVLLSSQEGDGQLRGNPLAFTVSLNLSESHGWANCPSYLCSCDTKHIQERLKNRCVFFVRKEVSHPAVAGVDITTLDTSVNLLKRFLNIKTLRLIEAGIRHQMPPRQSSSF